MENQKELKEYIKKITDPIFKRVLKEQPTNPMRGSTNKIIRLIQPHNFRRYFTFSKTTYNPAIPYSKKNYNSEHHYTNFYGCMIIIRKKSAEVINLWHQKQWRLLEAQSINEINDRINEIKQEMEETTVKALKKFVIINGGDSDFIPIKKRETEIGIHGDDYLDKIPPEMVIHDTYFKKVYKEKVEFIGEESVKSYIQNRAVESIAPEIAQSINSLHTLIVPAIENLAKNMNTHVKVMKNINSGIKKFNKTVSKLDKNLSQRRLREYGG